MHFGQRKIAEDETQLLAEMFLDFLHDGIGASAIGALVVAILDERDGCGCVTLNVIGWADGNFQRAHDVLLFAPTQRRRGVYFGKASRAVRMPSAPGFTATGEM